MTNQDYRQFRAMVETANGNDPVWHMGWAWMDLTERQGKDMIGLLRVHPAVIRDGDKLRLPGGLELQTGR